HNLVDPSSFLPSSSQTDISYIEDPFNPNLDPFLESQNIITSMINSELTTSTDTSLALRRVGPSRQKPYIIFDTMNNTSKAKFINWWRSTIQGSDLDTQRRLRWDNKHSSDV
ncbi:unnamed protein product, partial [Penicillium salamii]